MATCRRFTNTGKRCERRVSDGVEWCGVCEGLKAPGAAISSESRSNLTAAAAALAASNPVMDDDESVAERYAHEVAAARQNPDAVFQAELAGIGAAAGARRADLYADSALAGMIAAGDRAAIDTFAARAAALFDVEDAATDPAHATAAAYQAWSDMAAEGRSVAYRTELAAATNASR